MIGWLILAVLYGWTCFEAWLVLRTMLRRAAAGMIANGDPPQFVYEVTATSYRWLPLSAAFWFVSLPVLFGIAAIDVLREGA